MLADRLNGVFEQCKKSLPESSRLSRLAKLAFFSQRLVSEFVKRILWLKRGIEIWP